MTHAPPQSFRHAWRLSAARTRHRLQRIPKCKNVVFQLTLCGLLTFRPLVIFSLDSPEILSAKSLESAVVRARCPGRNGLAAGNVRILIQMGSTSVSLQAVADLSAHHNQQLFNSSPGRALPDFCRPAGGRLHRTTGAAANRSAC